MKRIITLMMMLFLTSGILTAQDSKKDEGEVVINHKVELGETVLMICKKYVVLPNDFYKYNKEAIHGVRPNDVLRIPLHKSKKKNAIEAFKDTSVAANIPEGSKKVSAKD